MKEYITRLEQKLNTLYARIPALPKEARDWLTRWLPWGALVAGAVSAWSAWGIWQWGHGANTWIDYANRLNATYGGPVIAPHSFGLLLWVALLVVLAEAALYGLAFRDLRARIKAGWNKLFYASLLNLLYGLLTAFTAYGDGSFLLGSLIGTALAFYLLYQVRDQFKEHPEATPARKK